MAGDVYVFVLYVRLVCGLDHVNASSADSVVRVRSGKEQAQKDGFSFVVRILTNLSISVSTHIRVMYF